MIRLQTRSSARKRRSYLQIVSAWRGVTDAVLLDLLRSVQFSSVQFSSCVTATYDACGHLAWNLLGVVFFLRSLYSKFSSSFVRYACTRLMNPPQLQAYDNTTYCACTNCMGRPRWHHYHRPRRLSAGMHSGCWPFLCAARSLCLVTVAGGQWHRTDPSTRESSAGTSAADLFTLAGHRVVYSVPECLGVYSNTV